MRTFSEIRVKNYGASYQIFACFVILNYIVPFNVLLQGKFFNIMALFSLISGVLCIGLLFAAELGKKYHSFFPLYWHFTLMICLPFTSFTMLILNNADIYWLFNATLSLFLLALLVDWLSFIFIITLGSCLSYFVSKIFYHDILFFPSQKNVYLTFYTLGFSLIVSLFFSRNRENFIEAKFNTLRALGGTIAHELRTPLAALNLQSYSITDPIKKLIETYRIAQSSELEIPEIRAYDLKKIENSTNLVQNIIKETMLMIEMLLMKLKNSTKEAEKMKYSMKETIEEAMAKYPLYEAQMDSIKFDLENDFLFFGNKSMFFHVLFNLLKNSIHYIRQAKKGDILISLESTEKYNRIYFKDTGSGIPAEILPYIFDKFYSDTQFGTGLGLAYCKLVMEDLGGNISCESVNGQYAVFILEFPVVEIL